MLTFLAYDSSGTWTEEAQARHSSFMSPCQPHSPEMPSPLDPRHNPDRPCPEAEGPAAPSLHSPRPPTPSVMAQMEQFNTALASLRSRRSRRYSAQILEEALAIAEVAGKIRLLQGKAEGMGPDDWIKWLALVTARAAVDQIRQLNPVRVPARRTAADRLEPCKVSRRGRPLLPLREDAIVKKPQTGGLDADEMTLIHKAIAELRPELRDVVVVRCIEGHSQKETAKQLGITPHVVNHRLAKAKRLLREKLAGKVG